ncbi:hypothetical protein GCM10025865_13490 [Paraoerskovia sediminicola]|uniref:Uncharacterized protein n=1 Tax=Paraoerskovia sediminicola TaxID=1138587 RepID=A0ABN6XBG0_9CELL|nr:hypothetical protein GCM10025865_13490 [Paraoerskovia sediminicola]
MSVAIASVSPEVMRSGDDLTVTTVVRADADAPDESEDLTVSLGIDRATRAHDRAWVERWDTADLDADTGRPVKTEPVPALAAGTEETVTFTVSWAQLGLSRSTAWGALGLSIVLSDDGAPVSADRTFAVWDPETGTTPTLDLGFLVPLVGPAVSQDPVTASDDVVRAVADDARLGHVLAATADEPAVAWAADPALVRAAATSDSASAQDWADAVTSPSQRVRFALPAFDPDTAAYAHADLPLPDLAVMDDGSQPTSGADPTPSSDPAPGTDVTPTETGDPIDDGGGAVDGSGTEEPEDPQQDSSASPDSESDAPGEPDGSDESEDSDTENDTGEEPDPEATGTVPVLAGWRTDLAWPAAGPDAPTVETAVAAGRSIVVLDPGSADGEAAEGAMGLPDALTDAITPAVANTTTAAGDATLLSPDPALSALVTALTTLPGNPSGGRDRLLAETAVIAASSDDARSLVALPRTWNPDPALATEVIADVSSLPWVAVAPVDDLAADASTDPATAPALPDRMVSPDEIPASTLDSLADHRERLAQVSGLVPDPAALATTVDDRLVSPTSVVYRQDPGERETAVEVAQSAATALLDAVHIVPGSDVNLIAAEGGLPVRVSNGLPQEATVRVVLDSDDPRLRVNDSPVTTVPADSEVIVEVPVTAVGSGNVSPSVHLETLDGQELADPITFALRMRAAWATVGTAVIAGLFGILLIAGIWRTVKRGRGATRAAQAAVDEPPAPSDDPRAER